MAGSGLLKRRQLKALRRKKKKLVKKVPKAGGFHKISPDRYVGCRILDSLVTDSIFDSGSGNVILARATPHGEVAVSAFVVDVFCLGVKEAFFAVMQRPDYGMRFKPMLLKAFAAAWREMNPECLRKLVEGAVTYAQTLGFEPAEEYSIAARLFGDVDLSQCEKTFTFGRKGRPCYVQGPSDDEEMVYRVLKQLQEKCGEGGFDYYVMLDGEPKASSPELLEKYGQA